MDSPSETFQILPWLQMVEKTGILPLGDNIKTAIQDAKDVFQLSGCSYVRTQFDTLISVVEHFENMEAADLKDIYEHLILKGLTSLHLTLQGAFEDDKSRDEILFDDCKMLFYILVHFTKNMLKYEGKKVVFFDRKKKQALNAEEEVLAWDSLKVQTVNAVENIVELPLTKFWKTHIPSDFIDYIGEYCYTMLETPNWDVKKMQSLSTKLFGIIAILLLRYEHEKTCIKRFLQMLQSKDHLVGLVAQCSKKYVESYRMGTFVDKMIEAIIESMRQEMDVNEGDVAPFRNFSKFIAKVASLQPSLILNSLGVLCDQLDEEPYSMRRNVLHVLFEIISNNLSNGDLSDDLKDMKGRLLDLLFAHITDVNAFVRSKVLKLWMALCKTGKFPIVFCIKVLEAATVRVLDKSSNVAKSAVRLISAMVETSEFSDEFEREPYVKRLLNNVISKELKEEEDATNVMLETEHITWESVAEAYYKEYYIFKADEIRGKTETFLNYLSKESMDAEFKKVRLTASKGDWKNLTDSLMMLDICLPSRDKLVKKCRKSHWDYYKIILRSIFERNYSMWLDGVELKTSKEGKTRKLRKPLKLGNLEFVQHKVKFCEDFLDFVPKLREAMTNISELLVSANMAEVLEAVEFFRVVALQKAPGAQDRIYTIFSLIHRDEPALKDAVVDAVQTLYFVDNNGFCKMAPEIVNDLLNVLNSLTVVQCLDFAKVVEELIKRKVIGDEFTNILWEIAANESKDFMPMYFLSMTTPHCSEMIIKHLCFLIDSLRHRRDKFGIVKYAMRILEHLPSDQNTRTLADEKGLIVELCHVINDDLDVLENVYYAEISMSAINVIFKLCDHAMMLSEMIIISCTRTFINRYDYDTLRSRYMMVGSHIVDMTRDYMQSVFCAAWVKQRMDAEKKRRDEQKGNSSDYRDEFEGDIFRNLQMYYVKKVTDMCDTELLTQMMKPFCALVLDSLRNLRKIRGCQSETATVIACMKLMMVSPKFTEENIDLLVENLRDCSDGAKVSALFIYSDLVLRFPNYIQPLTEWVFAMLKDESDYVRFKALSTMSALILNEMIKVRGRFSDLCGCILDENDDVRYKAEHLFQRLQDKGNVIYNATVEVIANFTYPEHALPQQDFKTIVDFLMKFPMKDKQAECFVETMCQRLGASEDEEQSCNLAYCLMMVPYTDRCTLKLLELMPIYGEKLTLPCVYRFFQNVVFSLKKVGSKINKEIIAELSECLDLVVNKGVEALSKREIIDFELEENDWDEEADGEKIPQKPRTPKRRKRRS